MKSRLTILLASCRFQVPLTPWHSRVLRRAKACFVLVSLVPSRLGIPLGAAAYTSSNKHGLMRLTFRLGAAGADAENLATAVTRNLTHANRGGEKNMKNEAATCSRPHLAPRRLWGRF